MLEDQYNQINPNIIPNATTKGLYCSTPIVHAPLALVVTAGAVPDVVEVPLPLPKVVAPAVPWL